MIKNYIKLLFASIFMIGWYATTLASSAPVPNSTFTNDTLPCRVYIKPSFSPECILTDYNKNNIDSIMEHEECIKACKGNQVIYEAICDSGVNYTWNVIGDSTHSTSHNGRKLWVTWGNSDYGSIRVEVQTSDSAYCSAEICVILIDSPQIASSTVPAFYYNNGEKYLNICLGETIEFIDESVAGDSPIVSHLWISDSTKKHSKNYSFTPINPNVSEYKITHIIYNECGCKDIEIYHIKVNPPADLVLSCYGTVCAYSSQKYEILNPFCSNYFWHVEGGSILSGQDSSVVTVQWDNPKSGYGVLSIDGSRCDSPCKAFLSTKIPIIGSEVEVIGPDTVCINDAQVYEMPLWGSTSYHWKISPSLGANIQYDDRYKTTITFTQPGTYTLQNVYECPFLKCGPSVSQTKTIVVRPQLIINSNDDELCENTAGTYVTNDTNNVTWKIFDEQKQLIYTATTDTLIYTFDTNGRFDVTAQSDNFCNIAHFIVSVRATPLTLTTVNGVHEACPNTGIPLSATPTSPLYYLSWEPTCQSTPQEADSVTILYGNTICDVNVYQVDKELGCRSNPYLHTVSQFQLAPIPFDTTYGCPGHDTDINLTDQSYACSYEWEINPANAASVVDDYFQPSANILINYTNNSTPSFNAIVKRHYCNDTTINDTIHVIIGMPDIPITILHDTSVCPKSPITFSTSLNDSITRHYRWEFNGITKYGPSVSFTTSERGVDTIKLVYRPYGDCDSIMVTSLVHIRNVPRVSPITYDTATNNLTITSYDNNVTYEWVYNGNVISYNSSCPYYGDGTYDCFVRFINDTLCSAIKRYIPSQHIHCLSLTLSSRELNCPHTIEVENESNPYNKNTLWSVGDSASNAGIIVIDSSISHITFSKPGRHTLYANMMDSAHCYFDSMYVNIPIVPDFEIKDNCDNTITIVDKSLYAGTPYNLTRRFYLNNQTSFFATIPSGSDSIVISVNNLPRDTSVTISMRLANYPNCHINKDFIYYSLPTITNINLDTATRCNLTPHLFTATATNAQKYRWDFGDGSHNFGNNIYHTYNDKTLQVNQKDTLYGTLTVTNPLGCSVQDTFTIINTLHNLNGSIQNPTSRACAGVSKQITYSYKYATSYYWKPRGESISDYRYMVYETDTYKATLTDDAQCKGQGYRNISFNTAPKAQIISKKDYCWNEEVKLIGNTGVLNTYRWSLFYNNTPISIANPYQPNLIFTPTQYGVYRAHLRVNGPTVNGCSSSTQFIFYVHPPLQPPTITFGNNRCIHTPPVDLVCTSGQSLLWSNGQQGLSAQYYTDGIASAFYIDNNTQCPSPKATINILPEPNYDGLLTGCYEMCKEELPNHILTNQLYHYYHNDLSWEWFLDNNRWDFGYSPMDSLLINSFGDFQLSTTYDLGCISLSPVLSIQEIDTCNCKVEIKIKEVKNATNQCKVVFNIVLDVYNQESVPVTFTHVYSNNGNITINNSNLPLQIQAQQSELFEVEVKLNSFDSQPIELIFVNNGKNCTKKVIVPIDLDNIVQSSCTLENLDVQFEPDDSTPYQTLFFDCHFTLPPTLGNPFYLWSDPAQVMFVNYVAHSNSIYCRLMMSYSTLSQLKEEGQPICFYAIMCDQTQLCKIEACINADDLLNDIPSEFFSSEVSNQPIEVPSYALPNTEGEEPILIPNPAHHLVTIGNLSPQEILQITLFDMEGRQLLSVENKYQFSVADLPIGIYMVSIITSEDKVYYQKLIKY